ncbi:unnamed protein product [Gongylonema pulchrum]|uniref:Bromo domain-containing protein n=1 Tax=Gongylonema pulchrum TaxID=637853 RepID=A0A183F0X1_9BILA|nr:unnamed protein product [Gongylonema pulchrum]
MDIDRRRQEAAEYRRKPRLIEDSEIPESIVKASQHFINEEKESQKEKFAFESIGRRKRKEVDYSQKWIEYFLKKFLNSGSLYLPFEDLMSDRDWLRSIDEDLIVFDDVFLPTGDDDDEPPKRKRASPEITSVLNKLHEALITFKTSSGKQLAGAFEQLPSRRELPDYYEIIEKPMDLNKVKRKIRDGKYRKIQY